jgi:hypothetical protein
MKVRYIEDYEFYRKNGVHECPHLTNGMEYVVTNIYMDSDGEQIYMIHDDDYKKESDEAKPYNAELFEFIFYKCPCCRRMTLYAENKNEICETCQWQDEPYAKKYPDQLSCVNDGLSLNQYRSRWNENKKRGIYNQNSYNMAKSYSRFNRADIENDKICGCYYCLTIFLPSEINEWCRESMRGDGVTAICPRCGIDSVIGDSSGYPINLDLLKALRKNSFGDNV